MAASRQVPVETVLTARDTNTVSLYNRLADAADNYAKHSERANLVGMAGFGGMGVAVAGALTPLRAVAAAAYAGGQQLVSLASEAEKSRSKLAGDIKVYGFAKDYADALLLADKQLNKIREDAAKLPGEDSDFIQAFSVAFPAMAEKGKRSLEQMVSLSNNLTAVLKSKGVDTGQIARDIGLLVRGRAGLDVRSFVELQSLLGDPKKGGTVTTEQWNKLKVEDRFKRLEGVIEKSADTIKAFGNSWDAATSTLVSYAKQVAREFGGPLFEALKRGVNAVNDYVGMHIKAASQIGVMVMNAGLQGGGWLAGKVGSALGNLAPRGFAVGAAAAAAPAIFNDLATAGLAVVKVLSPLTDGLSSVYSAVLGFVSATLPGLSRVGEIFISVAGLAVEKIAGFVGGLANQLGPSLAMVGGFFSNVAMFFGNVFLIVGAKLLPVLEFFGSALTKAAGALVSAYEWIVKKIGVTGAGVFGGLNKTVEQMGEDARKQLGIGRVDGVGAVTKWYEEYEKERKRLEHKRALDEYRATVRAGQMKKPVVNQDFRGSHFNIEQHFDKGMEGRVLTAVREDAHTLANRRTRAGITPLWGQQG